jgi:hypothetical protein
MRLWEMTAVPSARATVKVFVFAEGLGVSCIVYVNIRPLISGLHATFDTTDFTNAAV